MKTHENPYDRLFINELGQLVKRVNFKSQVMGFYDFSSKSKSLNNRLAGIMPRSMHCILFDVVHETQNKN